jgi:hypothetical protein
MDAPGSEWQESLQLKNFDKLGLPPNHEKRPKQITSQSIFATLCLTGLQTRHALCRRSKPSSQFLSQILLQPLSRQKTGLKNQPCKEATSHQLQKQLAPF